MAPIDRRLVLDVGLDPIVLAPLHVLLRVKHVHDAMWGGFAGINPHVFKQSANNQLSHQQFCSVTINLEHSR